MPAAPHLGVRRGAAGEPELAADPIGALEQGHRVAVGRRLQRGGHARGPGPDDRDPQAPLAPRARRQRALATRARVDEAADRHARVIVADAGLVAADAADDVRRAPRRRLGHELRIGDQRPGHADGVRGAGGHEALGGHELVDAGRADQRHVDRGPHARQRALQRVGRQRRRRDDPGRARHVGRVAEHEGGEVHQPRRGERGRDLRAVLGVEAVRGELVGREPHADRERRARPRRAPRRAPRWRSAAAPRTRRRAGWWPARRTARSGSRATSRPRCRRRRPRGTAAPTARIRAGARAARPR